MGLDITLVRSLGESEDGCLRTRSVENEKWDDTRMVIRHEISKKIKMKSLTGSYKYDTNEVYRPENFEDAYSWANSIEDDGERKYITNILDILKSDDDLYLDYGY